MLKVLFGEESYLVNKALNLYLEGQEDYNIHSFDEFSSEVFTLAGQYPMFGGNNNIVVHVDKLENADFEVYMDSPYEHSNMFVVAKAVDKRKKVYKILKSKDMIEEYKKLNETEVVKFCKEYLQERGKTTTNDDIRYIVNRSGYLLDETVDLYFLQNCLEQLCCAGEISKKTIDIFVEETNTAKVFALSDYLLNGKGSEALVLGKRFLDDGENAIMILSLLMRVFRLAYKASLYKDKNEKELSTIIGVPSFQYAAARNKTPEQITDCLNVLQKGVEDIKGGKGSGEQIFVFTLSRLNTVLGR